MPVIRKVHFQNFRCLRDVELTLEPLTVLVGPNSSGKTTVLEGLRYYEHPRQQVADFWRHDLSNAFSITWDFGEAKPFIFRPKPERYGDFPGSTLVRGDHRSQLLSFDLGSLRQENTLANAQELTNTGDNLTNVFASLTRKQQSSVAQELCRLVPMFGDVDLQPTDRGRHQLRFQDRWSPSLWLTPSQVSDGTMLVLAFIVLQYQEMPIKLISIEDPERALHPYLLGELIQLLRKMSMGTIGGKPVQIVLATHSAELLDHVRPEEVRFLTRSQEDGSVQVNLAPTDTTNWRRVYEEYNESLGSIWLSGGMGGVPGA